MPTTKSEMPSEAELTKAREVLRREQEARAQKQREEMAPVYDIINSKEYQKVKELIDALPLNITSDLIVAPHISAIRAGMAGLHGVGA